MIPLVVRSDGLIGGSVVVAGAVVSWEMGDYDGLCIDTVHNETAPVDPSTLFRCSSPEQVSIVEVSTKHDGLIESGATSYRTST